MVVSCKKKLPDGETCPVCGYNKEKHVLRSTLGKHFYRWPPTEIAKLAGTEKGVHGNTPFYDREETLEKYKSPLKSKNRTLTKTIVIKLSLSNTQKRYVRKFLQRYMHIVHSLLKPMWNKLSDPQIKTILSKTAVVHARLQTGATIEGVRASRKALVEKTQKEIKFWETRNSKRAEEKKKLEKKYQAVLDKDKPPNLKRLAYRASGNSSLLQGDLENYTWGRGLKFTLNVSTKNRKLGCSRRPGRSIVLSAKRNKLFNRYLKRANGKFSPCMLFEKNGEFYVGVVFTLVCPQTISKQNNITVSPKEVCGIDLGASWEDDNFVVFDDGHRISAIGRQTYSNLAKKNHRIWNLREKSGGKLARYDRMQRQRKHWHEQVAREVIKYVRSRGLKVIVLEKLDNVKRGKKNSNKTQRKRLTSWNYRVFTAELENLAKDAGVKLIYAHPAYTSRMDSSLLTSEGLPTAEWEASKSKGSGRRVSRGKYASAHAGTIDADVNAARNIRAKGLSVLVKWGKLSSYSPGASSCNHHNLSQSEVKAQQN